MSDSTCPDCSGFSRRSLLKTAAAGAMASLSVPVFADALKPKVESETLVTQLFGTLTEEQRKIICFPFDHKLRSAVDNNWMIVKESIAKILTKDQIDLVRQIFRGIHSEEYADIVFKQVEHDSKSVGGFNASAIAMFGEPG